METLLKDIIEELRRNTAMDATRLDQVIRSYNRTLPAGAPRIAKKNLHPFYLEFKRTHPDAWAAWEVDPALERALAQTLRMKPRRTASGVATITVITKPWPCSSACLYCPNDVRMPKSYLHDEPACQRAEQVWFDPYLQAYHRLKALADMGHATDKIELIVLGGTWSDYPLGYQIWFIERLFAALNDGLERGAQVACERRAFYEASGVANDDTRLAAFVEEEQRKVAAGEKSFNRAIGVLYGSGAWAGIADGQRAAWDGLFAQHTANETARHRVVGLVVETRPDLVDVAHLTQLRTLGCTKVQIGVQSTRQDILDANHRAISVGKIGEAFALLRAFGFKIHGHFMANLLGATPEADKEDYRVFVTDPRFMPDEIKLYPCALIEGTALCRCCEEGRWRPYGEDELLDILESNMRATPPFVRVSRMIRDFSSADIVCGNKKPNLRQMVDGRLGSDRSAIQEIRSREIVSDDVDLASLTLDDYVYETSASVEHFLQWVLPDGRIAGFLRLSLPAREFLDAYDGIPVGDGAAMIREVHVYGVAAPLAARATAQHRGLGRALVAHARRIASDAGFAHLNVISSVGTREYYRHLGFSDAGLYQRIDL